ncbi:LOW QUALITY PROTEIN: amino acid transporter AVT6E [Cryptomeria japonica]|uniref:LOW QUALITY PROTEIN: amino acid transporter AVT6E n=1 Tax=Cryptomeria japonica TaxID=3369 RepID=UPI0027DA181E|nr:LOW QUALITY PROTEIN: amino acid transporter AVT6E [Cryptomeria japonica]
MGNPAKHSFIELQMQDISLESSDGYLSSKSRLTEENGNDNDVLPLLPSESETDREKKLSRESGIPSAVFNLATSVIGAGIMALPATMKVLGLPLGFTLIILMGFVSEISIEILVNLSVVLKASTYGEAVQSTCGHVARVVLEVCIIVNNAGILIVYLIIMGDVMSGSSQHKGIFDEWIGRQGWWGNRRLIVLITMLSVLAPLCSLKKIDSLKFTSAASVALAVVFVAVSSIVALIKLVEGKIERPRLLPNVGSRRAILDLLVVIPIMTNAYICHFNIHPIYNELQGRTPAKMNKVGRITTVLCILVYASTAISGYLLFGEATESDVLTNFDKDLGIAFSSILDNIIRVGYILHLLLVFPVIHFSLRQTMDCLVFKGSKPLSVSRNRFFIMTTATLAFLYLGSTVVPNIWVAFQFTGATTGLSLGFIFPSLIALRSNQQERRLGLGNRMLSWTMLAMALVVSIIGVVGNVFNLTVKND